MKCAALPVTVENVPRSGWKASLAAREGFLLLAFSLSESRGVLSAAPTRSADRTAVGWPGVGHQPGESHLVPPLQRGA